MKYLKNRILQVVVLTAVALVLYLCVTLDQSVQVTPWGENINTKHLPVFRKTLAQFARMEILEGLPHQVSEPELLASEQLRKDTVEHHGYQFYALSKIPSEADAQIIRASLSAKDGISKWESLKRCGGFHPDFLVRWYDHEETFYEALVCFGCEEIKLYGEIGTLYANLGGVGYRDLVSALRRYGNIRPSMQK